MISTNAITAPNYTQIPNIVFDYWMAVLSPAEFKVLLCICRKTFGWKKDYDRISLKQLEKMTGLSRKGITQNLDSLIAHGLVTKVKSKTTDGDDAPNQYEINVNCMGEGSEINTLGVVNSVTQGVVNSVHPQKKDYTKERLTKETHTLADASEVGVSSSSSSTSSAEIEQKDSYGEHKNCKLTKDEHGKLLAKLGQAELDYWIETIDLEAEKQGHAVFAKKYKSHYATILSWKRMRKEQGRDVKTGVANHRQNSKLAFETESDSWKPTYANKKANS